MDALRTNLPLDNNVLVGRENRGGGTGYGKAGFTVKSRYKCN